MGISIRKLIRIISNFIAANTVEGHVSSFFWIAVFVAILLIQNMLTCARVDNPNNNVLSCSGAGGRTGGPARGCGGAAGDAELGAPLARDAGL